MCLFGAAALWEILFYLLPRGCHELQTLPTGKAAPVVPDDDVIEESIIIFDDIHTYWAAQYAVILSQVCLLWHVDGNV